MLPILAHIRERTARDGTPPPAAGDLRRIVDVLSGAKAKNDLALLAVIQLETDLNSSARIERNAELAGELRARHGRRTLERAIAADELRAIARKRPGGVVYIEERGAVGEFRVVWIAREYRAASNVGLGDDVHHRLRAQITEHPFNVTCRRQLARTTGLVTHLEDRKLDRRITRDIYAQLRRNAGFGVLENAVAETVARDIGRRRTARQRRRRPKCPLSSSRI
jgi:hypothetical protein